jgi:hypothetical protein
MVGASRHSAAFGVITAIVAVWWWPAPAPASLEQLVLRFEDGIASASGRSLLDAEFVHWDPALAVFVAETPEGRLELRRPGEDRRTLPVPPSLLPACTTWRWSTAPSGRWMYVVREPYAGVGCVSRPRRGPLWRGFVHLPTDGVVPVNMPVDLVGWQGDTALVVPDSVRAVYGLDPTSSRPLVPLDLRVVRVVAVSTDGTQRLVRRDERRQPIEFVRPNAPPMRLDELLPPPPGLGCAGGGVTQAQFADRSSVLMIHRTLCSKGRPRKVQLAMIDTEHEVVLWQDVVSPDTQGMTPTFATGPVPRISWATHPADGQVEWRVVSLIDGSPRHSAMRPPSAFPPRRARFKGLPPALRHLLARALPPPASAPSLAAAVWSPDGQHLVTVLDREVRWWHVNSGRTGRRTVDGDEPPEQVTWGPRPPTKLATTGADWAGFPGDRQREALEDLGPKHVAAMAAAATRRDGTDGWADRRTARAGFIDLCEGGHAPACLEASRLRPQDSSKDTVNEHRRHRACLEGVQEACATFTPAPGLPTPVRRLGPDPAEHLTAGDHHGCELRAGAVSCWGMGAFRGALDPPPGPLIDVAAGRNHTCGLRPNGSIVCWGWGGPMLSFLEDKVSNHGQATPPAGPHTAIAAGATHTCALDEAGSAVCWGSNKHGESTPPAGPFASIDAGEGGTCGVRSDGSLICWGANASEPQGRFIAAAVGSDASCALRRGGQVHCWDHAPGKTPSFIVLEQPLSRRFVSVSVGTTNAVGVDTSGRLYEWGSGRPRSLPDDGRRYVSVHAGVRSQCAVDLDGIRFCWGDSAHGGLAPGMRVGSSNF